MCQKLSAETFTCDLEISLKHVLMTSWHFRSRSFRYKSSAVFLHSRAFWVVKYLFFVLMRFCTRSFSSVIMAVATIEADEAVASSVFVQIMGTALKKLLVRVILIIFGHFASSDFKVWLRWWSCKDSRKYRELAWPGKEYAGGGFL